ncbi:putative hydrolase [Trichoderma barbatum]
MSPQNCADDTVDGTDCTLIPGLIDAKIDAGAAPWVFPRSAAAGVTTVIDASSETADATAMRRATSWTPGWPSYLAAGSAAGAPGGTDLTGLNMFSHISVEAVSSLAEAEQFVSKHVSEFYPGDFVGVIADVPGLDDQTLQALVNAAHRRGKLVVAHVTQTSSYRRALSAGCEIITPVPIDGELDSELISNYGDGIYEELQLLLQAGLSNAEALRAATSVPAQAFRLSDRGSIQIGKRPDLVLLQGNPLDDFSAIRHAKKVWIDGVEFDD